jgi:hypothetical protein
MYFNAEKRNMRCPIKSASQFDQETPIDPTTSKGQSSRRQRSKYQNHDVSGRTTNSKF